MQTPAPRPDIPPKRSNLPLILAGVAAVLVLLCCGGVALGGFGVLGFLRTQAPVFGTAIAQLSPVVEVMTPIPPQFETPGATGTGGFPGLTPIQVATPAAAVTPETAAVTPATRAPATATPAQAANTPQAAATSTTSQPLDPGQATLQALKNAVISHRDLVALTQQLRLKSDAPIKLIVNDTTPQYKVGDSAEFWVTDNDNNTRFKTRAVLRYISQHLYFWVDEKYNFSQAALKQSADVFDTKTYPTNHKYYGTEPQPGIDNDPRLTVFIGKVPGVGGYFSASDMYPKVVNPSSNERKMFFINADDVRPGTSSFDDVMSHEFQHMIHFNMNPTADTWVDEGSSVLAEFLNGFGNQAVRFERAILSAPDTQLTNWSSSNPTPNYGAGYMFIDYFAQRFGGYEILKDVYGSDKNGKSTDLFESYLKQKNLNFSFEDVFRDWVIANLVNDKSVNNGIYSYNNHTGKATITKTIGQGASDGNVHEYATDYLSVNPQVGEATVSFKGDTTSRLLPFDQPSSGQYYWYSNRGDRSDMTLTRDFDLSKVQKATLTYSAWYQIEYGWDYCYVEVSTDGGKTWDILKAPHSTDYDPQGNSFGWGYSGPDKNGQPAWVNEQVDLSKYAGKQIKLRFEYVTDDAYNEDGFAVDDIAIPELNFRDDAEKSDNGWVASGFVRVTNTLPQRFIVQVVSYGPQVQVAQMQLDANNAGQVKLTGLGKNVTKVVLVVSAIAPTTIHPANYTVTVK